MNPDTPRFWPQNPGHQPDRPQPEDLLRAAAAELGPATDFEVVAEVDTHVNGAWLEHAFYLVSEKVGYRYLLFRARHRLGFPVTLSDRPGDDNQDFDPSAILDRVFGAKPGCATSEELEQTLKELFENADTQRIVGHSATCRAKPASQPSGRAQRFCCRSPSLSW